MRFASHQIAERGAKTMDGMIFLIPIALLMGFIGLLAFLWNLKNRQYDDPKGAAMRILNDDDFPLP
jgi:cbb3-type cytochrome oxidase maturation protein